MRPSCSAKPCPFIWQAQSTYSLESLRIFSALLSLICFVELTIVRPVQPGTIRETEPKKQSSTDELSSRAYVAHKSSRQRASTCAGVSMRPPLGLHIATSTKHSPLAALRYFFCVTGPQN